MEWSVSRQSRRLVSGALSNCALARDFDARPERISLALVFGLLVATTLATPANSLEARAVHNPLAWFAPEIPVPDEALERMGRREVVSWMLPAEGDELALFVGSAIRTDARSLVGEVSRTEQLWTGKHVPHAVRFSTPPRIEDVAALVLGADDLEALRRCQPRDCDVKLSEPEIARMRAAIERAPASWQAAAQDEFRRIVVDRATAYLAEGRRSFLPYLDKSLPVDSQRAFEDMMRGMPLVSRRLPSLASYFDDYPNASRSQIRSFLLWMETTYTPKPTIQIIHTVILTPDQNDRAAPEVVVVRRQVYATHYVNALLSISALMRDGRDPSQRYLVYVNRSKLDGLRGWLRGVKRHFVEDRVRQSAEALFEVQRRRIEELQTSSGDEAAARHDRLRTRFALRREAVRER
jgi:hypothetical protein